MEKVQQQATELISWFYNREWHGRDRDRCEVRKVNGNGNETHLNESMMTKKEKMRKRNKKEAKRLNYYCWFSAAVCSSSIDFGVNLNYLFTFYKFLFMRKFKFPLFTATATKFIIKRLTLLILDVYKQAEKKIVKTRPNCEQSLSRRASLTVVSITWFLCVARMENVVLHWRRQNNFVIYN